MGTSSRTDQEWHEGIKKTLASEQDSKELKPSPPQSKSARRIPKDRYIAAEMANWTKVFRFGHMVLLPTFVNDSQVMLFGLDTGAFADVLSLSEGRQLGKVNPKIAFVCTV
jgi:hypothetical protein